MNLRAITNIFYYPLQLILLADFINTNNGFWSAFAGFLLGFNVAIDLAAWAFDNNPKFNK